MSQDFKSHPVLVNYEASRDGVVRHRRLQKPVGWVNNTGYLMFSAGKKKYYNHRIVYECYFGLIKDGLVIDHIDSCTLNNKLENLQAVSQSQNTKKGRTGTCNSVGKRIVESFNTVTNEKKIFQSMNAAGKHFGICMPSVRRVAENITKSAISKETGHKIQFIYI